MKIRIISVLLLLVFTAIGFTSCNTDGDSRYGDVQTGTVTSPGISGQLFIEFDMLYGVALPVTGIPKYTGGSDVAVGDRVYLSFYINEKPTEDKWYDNEIEIIEIVKLSSREPIIVEGGHGAQYDTLGTMPFYSDSQYPTGLWVVNNTYGHYLTLSAHLPFQEGDQSTHWVSLGVYDKESYENAADEVSLELRHGSSSKNENPVYNKLSYGIISFDLKELAHNMLSSNKDSITLAIKVPILKYLGSSEQPEEKIVKLKLKNPNASTTSAVEGRVPKLPKNLRYNALLN